MKRTSHAVIISSVTHARIRKWQCLSAKSIERHVSPQTPAPRASVLVEEVAGEGAVLPAAAVDGAAVQAQPDAVALVQLQHRVVAGSLVVGRSVVGVGRHHHLLVAHQVDVERHVDGQLEDVEEEGVGAVGGAQEAAQVHVEGVAQVAVEQVEDYGLVQGARGEVDGAGGGESHAHGHRVHVHGHEGGALAGDRHVDGGDAAGVPRAPNPCWCRPRHPAPGCSPGDESLQAAGGPRGRIKRMQKNFSKL